MTCRLTSTTLFILSCTNVSADDLEVGKTCPVTYQNQEIGMLVFSKYWFHSSRDNANYIAGDNATGVGIEIHLVNNTQGHLQADNIANCDKYRLLQIRKTTARLHKGEKPVQVDVPDHFESPFYDNAPLKHGYGVHQTPVDMRDKPWSNRPTRASTVAIYDTPYVSDAYGIEGKDIKVEFETCAVCERINQFDTVLSCGHWGYTRDFIGGATGWTEPEEQDISCDAKPSQRFETTLNESHRVDYSYWINWR